MKSEIHSGDLELTVISKNNKVESFKGNSTIKSLVKDCFNKSIDVITCTEENNGSLISHVQKVITLNPGDKDYIQAVLIERIQNNLALRVNYNVKEKGKNANKH